MKGIKISVEERERAWLNYRNYYSENASGHVFSNFFKLLGSPYDFTPNAPFYTYPPEAARKVFLLAGPHAHTLLKAREILKHAEH